MTGFIDFTFASDDEIGRELGARIKQTRLLRGLQQMDLAARAGVARATVVQLENQGKSTLTSLIRIIRALNLEAELQNLFVPPEPQSIAQMEVQAAAVRKRAPRKPKDGHR